MFHRRRVNGRRIKQSDRPIADRILPLNGAKPMSNLQATLYRMILPDHTCPFGVRAKELLEEHGYAVDDRILRSRDEVDAVKEEYGVATTPLVFVGDERIGGSDDLERYLASGSNN
jgi:glutaredoxin